MKKQTIVEIIAYVFVILFLYTGVGKLMEYDVAKEQIGLSPLLEPIAPEVVIILPILEIATAILLFFPKTRGYGMKSSLVLMGTFTGYVIYILSHNDQLPCTCGGVLEKMSWPQHLLFNSGMIILSLAGIILARTPSVKVNKNRGVIANA